MIFPSLFLDFAYCLQKSILGADCKLLFHLMFKFWTFQSLIGLRKLAVKRPPIVWSVDVINVTHTSASKEKYKMLLASFVRIVRGLATNTVHTNLFVAVTSEFRFEKSPQYDSKNR